MRKYLLRVGAMLFCLLLLSSCSANKKFSYDGSINWDSSSSDVLKKYGNPTRTDQAELQEGHTGSVIVYENTNCFGFEGFTRAFGFLDNDKKVIYIAEGTTTTPVLSKAYAEEIYNSLTKSYGKPTQESKSDDNWENGGCYWLQDDTVIMMQWNSTTEANASSSASVFVNYLPKEYAELADISNEGASK